MWAGPRWTIPTPTATPGPTVSDSRLDVRYGLSYRCVMSTGPESKPVFFLGAEIRTPPMSEAARREAGQLLRMVQDGEAVGMPRSRPMPSIGPGCHELRIRDEDSHWRVFYRIDPDIILVVLVVAKTTPRTPRRVIDLCKKKLRDFDNG
jgi:phage-related protein